MQAIIMAAGRGSRLEHLTDDKPKAFLEINNIKLIEYNIALLRHIGVTRIVLVTGYKSECFEELFANAPDIKIVYNPFYEFMNVVGSFFMGQEYLVPDEDIIYMHADTLCAPEILEEMLEKKGDMILPVEFKQCDEEAMKVRTRDGKVIEITKSIPCDIAEGEFIGIAKICACMLDTLKASVKKVLKEKNFNFYFEGAIQEIIDQNRNSIVAMDTKDYFWGEIDFVEDYNRVVECIPENLVNIAKEVTLD